MENSYGVGIDNRYALFLDDESDPLDAIKAREQAKELKKKAKEAEKEIKGKPETKPGVSVVTRKGIKKTQNVKSQVNITGEPQKPVGPARTNDRNVDRPPPRRRVERPQKGTITECKEGARPPRREFDDRRLNFERRNFSNKTEGGESRGLRCPGEPRDDQRGPRQSYDVGKQDFDRRLGSDKTVVKPIDKHEGAGLHNRVTPKDDLDKMNKTGFEGKVTEEKSVDTAVAGGAKQPKSKRVPPAEQKPRELTLDEYRAQRKVHRTVPQYNLRKAGEGEDQSKWKNLVKLEKKKEDWEDDESDEEYNIADYPQRVGRQKRVQGIEFKFNDNSRRGNTEARGRCRGCGRTWRGRGGQGAVRQEPSFAEERPVSRSHNIPPKVNDNKDFPSLG